MFIFGSNETCPPTLPTPVPGAFAVMTCGLFARGWPVAMSSAWSLWKNCPFSLFRVVNQIVFASASITGVDVMPTSGPRRPHCVSATVTGGPKLRVQRGAASTRVSSASNA
jgi:hypothetical protein